MCNGPATELLPQRPRLSSRVCGIRDVQLRPVPCCFPCSAIDFPNDGQHGVAMGHGWICGLQVLFQTVKKKVGSWAHDCNIFHRWQLCANRNIPASSTIAWGILTFYSSNPGLVDATGTSRLATSRVGSPSKPVLAATPSHTSTVIGSSTLVSFL